MTVLLLVALRLTIGWHFLYEGVWKINHADKFSARPFLTMAKGPAAPLFYAMVDDIDGRERLEIEDVVTAEPVLTAWKTVRADSETRYLARMTKANPGEENEKANRAAVSKLHWAMLPAYWEHEAKLKSYLEANEQKLIAALKGDGDDAAETVKTWMADLGAIETDYFDALKTLVADDPLAKDSVGRSVAKKAVPAEGTIDDKSRTEADGRFVLDVTIKSPKEAKEAAVLHAKPGIKGNVFLDKWDELRSDVDKKYALDDWQEAKVHVAYDNFSEALKIYLADNIEDIEGYFGSLERFGERQDSSNHGAAFQAERTWDEQQKLRSEVKGWLTAVADLGAAYEDAVWSTLTEEQKKTGDLPQRWTQQDLMDFAVSYGLTAIGFCLMIGFCTRLAALGGAAFLFSVLLTQPPWPTIFPHAPPVVGHALIIDKNFVEMMALFVLASTAVGRWAGLDHFLYTYLCKPCCNKLCGK